MYMSTEATEDILAVNKVLSLCIRDKLDCHVFWTLGWSHKSSVETGYVFCEVLVRFVV